MEKLAHCTVHRKRPAEYACPACDDIPLCKACGQEHASETGHAPENCKEVGLAIMHQHVQCAGGRLANEMVKGLRNWLKELETGLLREIDRFQSNCMQTEELSQMRKLDSEGRYAELYFRAKSLPADGAKNGAAAGELNKRLLEMIGTASSGFKNVLSEIAAAQQRRRTVFAAYKKDEVLAFKPESYKEEKQIVSSLKSVDMSKFKAAYVDSWLAAGDRVASVFASRLQTHPMSAVYLNGNNISDDGTAVLVQAAFRSKSLSAFCVASSKISDTGAKAVTEAVLNCRSLTMLQLNGWEISDSLAKAVARAVKGCPLSVFYLGSLRISDSGAIAVAETVKDCPLSTFCFWSNEMSDAGAIAVTEKMKDCPLSAFCLGSNKISDSGAAAVAETLSSGGCANTLSAFCLWSSDISDSGVKKLADTVRGYPLLSSFYFDGKPISGETATYILEGVTGVSTIRSVNLHIGDISNEQMDSCLSKVQKSGVARRLKLRFQCDTEAVKSVCKKFGVEWSAKLYEFGIVQSIGGYFINGVLFGLPK